MTDQAGSHPLTAANTIRMVTIHATAAMFLTAGGLNHLHAADQDGGCCPICCGPCAALKCLADVGQLDSIVREYAPGHEWWDDTTGRVGRVWLASAWRMTDCHDTTGQEVL